MDCQNDPVLSLDAISKTFESEEGICRVLDKISFKARANEILSIMGPSGCGKSTLLRIIAGLEHPESGVIRTCTGEDGNTVQVAMVFQEHALFPWLTVRDNVVYGLGLKSQRIPEEEISARSSQLLALTRLDSFASSYPHQLSGGMKQRVTIARALAVRPRILLMDEPFSALDHVTRRELQEEILRIRDASHRSGNDVTFLLITHNPEEALFLSDRILVLSDRPASVRGTLQVDLAHPRDVADQGFISLRQRVMNMAGR